MRPKKRIWRLAGIVLLIVIVGGVIGAALTGIQVLAPARVAFRFPARILAQEAGTMSDCYACHEVAKFHGCDSCHDDHGSAEMANVPFDALILLAGDVPQPGYIPVNSILPYRDQPHTHIGLLEFLADHDVGEFESVTLISRDEGFCTVERPNLTSASLLLPHVDGVRFADENLHVSTWLKGVWQIVVVGAARPLTIDGQPTSIGRLLIGPTRSVTVDQTDVMFKSLADGQVRKGKTASRLAGAALADIVANRPFGEVVIRDSRGGETTLAADDAQDALLAQVRGQVTLILPRRSRAQWIEGVAEIVSRP